MRRFIAGMAMLACVAAAPLSASADDREIAQQIIKTLKSHRDQGRLQGFTLDMKVENGVVLFKGQVSDPGQRSVVLKSADGITGVEKVVDQITLAPVGKPAVAAAEPAPLPPAIVAPPAIEQPMIAQAAPTANPASRPFSLREALRGISPAGFEEKAAPKTEPTSTPVAAAPAKPAAAPAGGLDVPMLPLEAPRLAAAPAPVAMPMATIPAPPSDQSVRDAIVARLGQAKRDGLLAGFGVNVDVRGGDVMLKGRVMEAAQRETLVNIVRQTPGVSRVLEDIRVEQVKSPMPTTAPVAHAAPLVSQDESVRHLEPVAVQHVRGQVIPTSTAPVRSATSPVPGMAPAPAAHMAQAPMPVGSGAAYGQPVAMTGMPMPMYPAPQAGCYGNGPRYESPNLPNYAWPGYAAYPNYAAVTYPQQYSPSAWPYIGPFYPYPQVPLGWRKVTLEWDDGWWFLDFTDR